MYKWINDVWVEMIKNKKTVAWTKIIDYTWELRPLGINVLNFKIQSLSLSNRMCESLGLTFSTIWTEKWINHICLFRNAKYIACFCSDFFVYDTPHVHREIIFSKKIVSIILFGGLAKIAKWNYYGICKFCVVKTSISLLW